MHEPADPDSYRDGKDSRRTFGLGIPPRSLPEYQLADAARVVCTKRSQTFHSFKGAVVLQRRKRGYEPERKLQAAVCLQWKQENMLHTAE